MIALAPDETETSSPQAGQTVQQIADEQGKHVIDALLDMCVEDDLATEFFADTQGRDQAQFTAEVLDSNHIVAGVIPNRHAHMARTRREGHLFGGRTLQVIVPPGPLWRVQRQGSDQGRFPR